MRSPTVKSVAAIALFMAALGALSVRQYRNLLDPADPRGGNWGMADFRDVIYYPAVAVLDGQNPYDSRTYMTEYPVGNVFPLYSPHLLLLCLPFGLLPFELSGVLFWLLLVATYPVFAALCLKVCEIRPLLHRVFWLATALLVSIPGRWAFDAGQLAVLWSMATLVALEKAETRPRTAGLGLLLAAVKPTFGVPLALLLLFQRRYLPVFIATGLAMLAGGVVLAIIAAGSGWGSVWSVLDQNQAVLEAAKPFNPAVSHTRVDANVFLLQVLGLTGGRWLELVVLTAIVLVAGATLRSLNTSSAASPAGALVLLAMIVCVYHQTYDAVLLAPIPLAVVAPSRRLWATLPRTASICVALLSAAPLFNVSWTKTFSAILGRGLNASEGVRQEIAQIAAVVNSTVCLLAFILLVGAIWMRTTAGEAINGPDLLRPASASRKRP
jgi:hypothetical protein